MKERPILFSGEMVRAILDGRKTMTRRVVKFPYAPKGISANYNTDHLSAFPAKNGGWTFFTARADQITENMKTGDGLLCPFGQPGDRLWVREAWAIRDCKPLFAAIFRADCVEDDSGERDGWWMDKDRKGEEEFIPGKVEWKPSIFMPRWASRITLEVTAVRVERVQDISGRDIEAEGFAIRYTMPGAFAGLDEFRALWDYLNAKRGYGWDANPWCWVISFKRTP